MLATLLSVHGYGCVWHKREDQLVKLLNRCQKRPTIVSKETYLVKLLHAQDGSLEPHHHLILAGITRHAQAVEACGGSWQVLRALVSPPFKCKSARAATVTDRVEKPDAGTEALPEVKCISLACSMGLNSSRSISQNHCA